MLGFISGICDFVYIVEYIFFMIITIIKQVRKSKSNALFLNIVQTVYGVGPSRSRDIIKSLGGRVELLISSYRNFHLNWCTLFILKKQYKLKDILDIIRRINKNRLKRIECYRGKRLILYLPSHGQRTKSNGISARYSGSKTFEYVPKQPLIFNKKISGYVKRKLRLKLQSDDVYNKLLRRNYNNFKLLNAKILTSCIKKNQLGVFKKFMKNGNVKKSWYM